MAPITFLEKVIFIFRVLPLSLILGYTAITYHLSASPKKKKLGRLLHQAVARYLAGSITSHSQIEWLMDPTVEAYRKWATKSNVETVMEDVPATGKKLLWMGNRNAKNVVLHAHGGGFMVPLAPYMLLFWQCVLKEYTKRTGKEDLAVVFAEYSLYPKTFPTQLIDLTHAFAHLLSTHKLSPSNIYLAGDSAGGNLAMQFVGHTLHPLPATSVPSSPLNGLNERLGGVLLISPWLSLNDTFPSHAVNDATDISSPSHLKKGGDLYLKDTEPAHIPYVKVLSEPAEDRWFEGIDRVTKRVFVAVGGAECMLDEGVETYNRIQEASKGKVEVKLDVEEGAVHEDMMMEFASGGTELTPGGVKVVEWLVEACQPAY